MNDRILTVPDKLKRVSFEVLLEDIDGKNLTSGRIIPHDGRERPAAISVDGCIYVDTGAVTGTGATGARRVYRRVLPSSFQAGVSR